MAVSRTFSSRRWAWGALVAGIVSAGGFIAHDQGWLESLSWFRLTRNRPKFLDRSSRWDQFVSAGVVDADPVICEAKTRSGGDLRHVTVRACARSDRRRMSHFGMTGNALGVVR